MTYSTCVTNIYVNIVHYTEVENERVLHGHTYKISVCFRAKHINKYVIDFLELKRIVNSVINKINNSILIPKEHLGKVSFKAPVNVNVKTYAIDGEATAENLAKHIADEVINTLRMSNINVSNLKAIMVKIEDPQGFKAYFSKSIS